MPVRCQTRIIVLGMCAAVLWPDICLPGDYMFTDVLCDWKQSVLS